MGNRYLVADRLDSRKWQNGILWLTGWTHGIGESLSYGRWGECKGNADLILVVDWLAHGNGELMSCGWQAGLTELANRYLLVDGWVVKAGAGMVFPIVFLVGIGYNITIAPLGRHSCAAGAVSLKVCSIM